MSDFSEEILYGFLGLSLKTEWNKKLNQSVFLPISELQRERMLESVKKEGKTIEDLYYTAAAFFASIPIFFKDDGGEPGQYYFWQRYDLRWEF